MARGDDIFAKVDVRWPDDPRCLALGNSDSRWAYIVLWCLAVAERRELLQPHWTTKVIAARALVPESAVLQVLRSGLVKTEGKRLRILGCKSKHMRMRFKDETSKIQ